MVVLFLYLKNISEVKFKGDGLNLLEDLPTVGVGDIIPIRALKSCAEYKKGNESSTGDHHFAF